MVVDMLRELVLGVHIAAGGVGLLVGPVAMAARKRRGRHTSAGAVYLWAAGVMASTAVALASWDLAASWWLGLIAVATEAAALGGVWVRRRRRPGWRAVHVQLMCGSYISFVTAFLVVNWESPLAWFAPTIIGTPLILRVAGRQPTATPAELV